MTQFTYSKRSLDYPFAINLDRCGGICNTLEELSSRICVPNETEGLNLNFLNIIIYVNVTHVKRYIFGILHVVVNMANTCESLLTIKWLRVMKLDIQQKVF